jgi:Uma2 family endonuclease
MNVITEENGTMSIDEYARMPDDGYRTELVRGLVVREPQPGYLHGNLQARLAAMLIRHIEQHGFDLVCLGPTGFILERLPPTVRGPDLAIQRKTRVPAPDHAGFVDGAPELVIEIASPSDTRPKIGERIADFLHAGARVVWVLYPGRQTVEVHDASGRTRTLPAADDLDGGDVLPGFQVKVATLFRM